MEEYTEKRRYPRKKMKWPVHVLTNDGPVNAESRNISVQGLFLRCEQPVPLDKVLSIMISPPNHASILVEAKMIWSNRYGIDMDDQTYVCIGVCLVSISDQDRQYLESMMSN